MKCHCYLLFLSTSFQAQDPIHCHWDCGWPSLHSCGGPWDWPIHETTPHCPKTYPTPPTSGERGEACCLRVSDILTTLNCCSGEKTFSGELTV